MRADVFGAESNPPRDERFRDVVDGATRIGGGRPSAADCTSPVRDAGCSTLSFDGARIRTRRSVSQSHRSPHRSERVSRFKGGGRRSAAEGVDVAAVHVVVVVSRVVDVVVDVEDEKVEEVEDDDLDELDDEDGVVMDVADVDVQTARFEDEGPSAATRGHTWRAARSRVA